MSVIAALTAQNTREVRAVHEVPAAMVAAQIDAVLEDIGADAVKIGMLASAGIIRAVADRLRVHLGGSGIPIVLDPVMIAKSGDRLLREDAVEALKAELLPLATVVTPNTPELETLTGLPVADRRGAAAGGRRRWRRAGRRCSPRGGTRKGRRSSICWSSRMAGSTVSPTPGSIRPRRTAPAAPSRRRSPPGWERGRSCRGRSRERSTIWRAPSQPRIL